jgi:hypothetical protein
VCGELIMETDIPTDTAGEYRKDPAAVVLQRDDDPKPVIAKYGFASYRVDNEFPVVAMTMDKLIELTTDYPELLEGGVETQFSEQAAVIDYHVGTLLSAVRTDKKAAPVPIPFVSTTTSDEYLHTPGPDTAYGAITFLTDCVILVCITGDPPAFKNESEEGEASIKMTIQAGTTLVYKNKMFYFRVINMLGDARVVYKPTLYTRYQDLLQEEPIHPIKASALVWSGCVPEDSISGVFEACRYYTTMCMEPVESDDPEHADYWNPLAFAETIPDTSAVALCMLPMEPHTHADVMLGPALKEKRPIYMTKYYLKECPAYYAAFQAYRRGQALKHRISTELNGLTGVDAVIATHWPAIPASKFKSLKKAMSAIDAALAKGSKSLHTAAHKLMDSQQHVIAAINKWQKELTTNRELVASITESEKEMDRLVALAKEAEVDISEKLGMWKRNLDEARRTYSPTAIKAAVKSVRALQKTVNRAVDPLFASQPKKTVQMRCTSQETYDAYRDMSFQMAVNCVQNRTDPAWVKSVASARQLLANNDASEQKLKAIDDLVQRYHQTRGAWKDKALEDEDESERYDIAAYCQVYDMINATIQNDGIVPGTDSPTEYCPRSCRAGDDGDDINTCEGTGQLFAVADFAILKEKNLDFSSIKDPLLRRCLPCVLKPGYSQLAHVCQLVTRCDAESIDEKLEQAVIDWTEFKTFDPKKVQARRAAARKKDSNYKPYELKGYGQEYLQFTSSVFDRQFSALDNAYNTICTNPVNSSRHINVGDVTKFTDAAMTIVQTFSTIWGSIPAMLDIYEEWSESSEEDEDSEHALEDVCEKCGGSLLENGKCADCTEKAEEYVPMGNESKPIQADSNEAVTCPAEDVLSMIKSTIEESFIQLKETPLELVARAIGLCNNDACLAAVPHLRLALSALSGGGRATTGTPTPPQQPNPDDKVLVYLETAGRKQFHSSYSSRAAAENYLMELDPDWRDADANMKFVIVEKKDK